MDIINVFNLKGLDLFQMKNTMDVILEDVSNVKVKEFKNDRVANDRAHLFARVSIDFSFFTCFLPSIWRRVVFFFRNKVR